MSIKIIITFTHCSLVLRVHIAIHREDFRKAASVHMVSFSDRHAVTHEHFGNNNMT